MSRRFKFTDIPNLENDLVRAVSSALEEDIGSGDITAELIPADQCATATIITRENCVVCGIPWAEEVFHQLDPTIEIDWQVADGEEVDADTQFCTLRGNTRALLTGERSALNFLQLLSGTATTSREYAKLVAGTTTKILDTRKTIPGLRTAQKYAVRCGGCHNHRIGLYDAFLIKENHIAACGSIALAIDKARNLYPAKMLEIEVESIEELEEAIKHGADVVMLDNFTEEMVLACKNFDKQQTLFEISGNVTQNTIDQSILSLADFISIGGLTKNSRAIDLSMTLID